MFQKLEIVTNAAREGARVLVLPNSVRLTRSRGWKQYLDAAGLDSARATLPRAIWSRGRGPRRHELHLGCERVGDLLSPVPGRNRPLLNSTFGTFTSGADRQCGPR